MGSSGIGGTLRQVCFFTEQCSIHVDSDSKTVPPLCYALYKTTCIRCISISLYSQDWHQHLTIPCMIGIYKCVCMPYFDRYKIASICNHKRIRLFWWKVLCIMVGEANIKQSVIDFTWLCSKAISYSVYSLRSIKF